MMWCHVRQFLSWLLLLGALVLFLFLGLGIFPAPPAAAAIRQFEEAPGQLVYQSRQTLPDQYGNRWQAIAFKRILSNGNSSFYLRLVGFPGVAEIDHSKPLTLTTSLGQALMPLDASSQIFSNTATPEPNVGQYDLQPILPQLQAEIPLLLTLPTTNSASVVLQVPSSFVQEWQTIAMK